jgi:hypothetical protein
MTFTVDNADQTTQKTIEAFRKFNVDTQLALLWFGYLDLKDELHPAPPIAVTSPADAVYDQIKALPKEEQLQAQREIAKCSNHPISRAYGALNPNSKLQVWLSLAQGMEDGTIIGMPEDYQLPAQTKDFTDRVKQLDLEHRISFAMGAVRAMGASIQ